MAGGEAAAQAQKAGEAAAVLEAHAEELGRLQRELADTGTEQWRSPAGRAFQDHLYALAIELGACREALERAAAAHRTVCATEQFEVWG
ncbi:MAG: hypothetical protein ABS910_14805 [Arthrobacter sp.]